MIVDQRFTRQYIPEDNSEHHIRRCENLKSHISFIILHKTAGPFAYLLSPVRSLQMITEWELGICHPLQNPNLCILFGKG
jgi:CDP-diacylglycerol pyrophosphatase